MRLLLALLFLCLNTTVALSQSYSFPLASPYEAYDIRTEGNNIVCLFKLTPRKAVPTIFRKVYLDSYLRPIDSIDYTLPYRAELAGNYSNEKYTVHTFLSRKTSPPKLNFLVCDRSGAIHSSFSKTSADFSQFFLGKLKSVTSLSLVFIDDYFDSDTLIIKPVNMGRSPVLEGQLFACSTEDGTVYWKTSTPGANRTLAANGKVVGLSSNFSGGYPIIPTHTLSFINSKDGKPAGTRTVQSRNIFRTIPVFATNGQDVMLAGMDYADKKAKLGNFFFSIYDLEGNRLVDRVDTAKLLSTQRLHPLGYTFDGDGNLLFIGEGWKLDYTAAIVTSALSIAAAITFGGYASTNTQPDYKITSLVIAKVSMTDGSVIGTQTFPVGPWSEFSTLKTMGESVIIENGSRAIIYDTNKPTMAPARFATLTYHQDLLLTPSGPVMMRFARKRMNLEILKQER